MGTTRLLALTVVAGWTLAPSAAGALDVGDAPDTFDEPVAVGPVAVDPDVSLAPGGAGAGAGVTVEVPGGDPLGIGIGADADEDGLTTGVRLPGAPSLPLPGDLPEIAVPELPTVTLPSLLDDPVVVAMPSAPPGSPADGSVDGSPPAAHDAPTGTRSVDTEPAVSARMGRPAAGLWTTIGTAAGHLAPWAALAALALAFQALVRSVLRERTRVRAAS